MVAPASVEAGPRSPLFGSPVLRDSCGHTGGSRDLGGAASCQPPARMRTEREPGVTRTGAGGAPSRGASCLKGACVAHVLLGLGGS